jgi:pimeloyl-[acyl-carrier protein] methyl ester esterase
MNGRPPITLVLLPGLDGTGQLFSRFAGALPPEIEPRVVSYPEEQALGYDELLPRVRDLLPVGRPFALLGESFSGPLALQLAAAHPDGLAAVILAASFHRHPAGRWVGGARSLVGLAMSRPPPAWAARAFLVGANASRELVAEIRRANAGVSSAVLAARVRAALRVDAGEALARCAVPLLYLGGARDMVVWPAAARALKALRPDAEVRILDAPHLVLQRRPAEAAGIVAEFLRRAAR